MNINQEFRVRKDLECYIVFFKGDAPLEMTEVAAFITELMKENKTREELINATKEKFIDIDADKEVDYTIQMLLDAGVLNDE